MEVKCLSGANINRTSNAITKMQSENLKYNRVIIHAGSINCANETAEDIATQYSELLDKCTSIATDRVSVSGILPRTDGQVEPEFIIEVNHKLRELSDKREKCDFIDHCSNFTHKNGQVVEGMLYDGMHLAPAGARRFLDNVGLPTMEVNNNTQEKWSIAGRNKRNNKNFQKQGQNNQFRGKTDSNIKQKEPNRGPKSFAKADEQAYCFFCGESGHISKNCRYESRLKCWGCGHYGHKHSLCRY